MRYRCSFCYYAITVDDRSRGYPVKCAGCGKTVQIPPGKFDPGCIIGDFVIIEKLGAGSIGSVYKATQLSLDRQVALKILSPEYSSGHGIKDFLREARSAAKLSHANLVQSLAVGEEDGICYMAMTYVNGENLKSRLRREGRIAVDEALHIVQQVAEALFYAWDEAGLIHRDVKPDNIMITDEGIVKLTDLGLAVKQSELSENMDISGTPSYMSPEQFAGDKLDPRTDIYSLGVTLYQLISGRLPFDGMDIKTLARQHAEGRYTPLRELVPGVLPEVEALVDRMMAVRREDRFVGMEELLKAIWTLRQKTAPNKSLVPDVHTISIKRLDYEMQNESSEIKARVTQQYSSQKLLMDRFFTAAGTALAVIVLMLMLWAIFAPEHAAPLKTYDRVLYFERLSSDLSLNVKSVLEEGRKILDQLPDGNQPEQKYNHQRMELLLANLELKRLRNEMQVMDQKKEAIENKRASEMERQIAELKSKLKSMSDVKQQLKRGKNDLAAAERRQKNQLWEIRTLRSRIVLEPLRRQVFECQRQYDFAAAEKMIEEAKRKNPALYGRFVKMQEWNTLLSRIHAMMTQSGTQLAGFPIGNRGYVLRIDRETVEYTDRQGVNHQRSWKDFSVQEWRQLLQMDPYGRQHSGSLLSACEFLLGRYGAAAASGNAELKQTISQYAAERMLLLESMSRAGSPGFRKKAEEFLGELRDAKGFDGEQAKLRDLLKQREE